MLQKIHAKSLIKLPYSPLLEIARELDEGKLCKQSQICRKIKELLDDKIKEA
jgi:hypothetical protein